MSGSVQEISLARLALALVPVGVVALLYLRWSLNAWTLLYGTVRMVLQLIAIGFILIPIFDSRSAALQIAVLLFMLAAASWIALRPLKEKSRALYFRALTSLTAGGVSTFLIIVSGVLGIEPWAEPRYVIPLAGMIFANAMNAVSLAADRLDAELKSGTGFTQARSKALETALLPTINTFFAVGLVSLPGMMTGQILAGVSPLTAVRYQMLVMCMVLGASGISAGVYLSLSRKAA